MTSADHLRTTHGYHDDELIGLSHREIEAAHRDAHHHGRLGARHRHRDQNRSTHRGRQHQAV